MNASPYRMSRSDLAVFTRYWLLPVLVTTLISACSLSRPNPDQSSWLVSPERTSAPRATPVNMHLKMGTFSANAPYDGKSLVYRMSDNKFEKDFYNVYLVYPRDMVANATMKWLTHSKAFTLVIEQPTTFFPMYQLQGVIDEFYGDYRDQPTAVVSIQFYASASFNGKNGMFSTPRITKRVPLADKSTQALITGQQQALSEILQELEARLVADAANAPPEYRSVTGRHVVH